MRPGLRAEDEARTRYLHLGKVALYQMSYSRGTNAIIPGSHRNVKGEFHLFSENGAPPAGIMPAGGSFR